MKKKGAIVLVTGATCLVIMGTIGNIILLKKAYQKQYQEHALVKKITEIACKNSLNQTQCNQTGIEIEQTAINQETPHHLTCAWDEHHELCKATEKGY